MRSEYGKIPRFVISHYTGNIFLVYEACGNGQERAVCVHAERSYGNKVGEKLLWEWSEYAEYTGDTSNL